MRGKRTFIAVLFSVLCALSADTVYLSNGDRITGTITGISAESIRIETGYGTFDIDRAWVEKGEFSTTAGFGRIEGAVLYFPFDGTLRNAAATEIRIGQSTVGEYTKGYDGSDGEAVYSRGTGQFIVLNTPERIRDADNLTIAFWVRVEKAVPTTYLFSIWDTTSDNKAAGKIAICVFNWNLVVYLVDANGTVYAYSIQSAVTQNTWEHFAFTAEPGFLTVYKNGEVLQEFSSRYERLNRETVPVRIFTAVYGSEKELKTYNAKAALDELYLWDKVLTPDEIVVLALDE